MTHGHRRWLPLLMAALATATWGQQVKKALPEPVTLRVGYSASVFYDVSVTDAHAATKVLADALMRNAGLQGTAEVTIIGTSRSLAASVRRDSLHVLAVLCSDYLMELAGAGMTPVFTAQREERYTEQYVLLTRTRGKTGQLEDLRGATLLTAVDWEASVPMMWLNVLLSRNGLPAGADFFGRVNTVKSTIKAALPVFFGDEDACLVPRSVYETMSELNPQIGRDLEILTASPGYSYGLACFSATLQGEVRKRVRDSLLHLHETPEGQQLLNLFYVDRLVPFDPVHIESTAELIRQHRQLEGK